MPPVIIAVAAAAAAAGTAAAVTGVVVAGITIGAVAAAAIGALAAIAVSYAGAALLYGGAGKGGSGDSSTFNAITGLKTSSRAATAPHQIVYGRVRKGGVIVFIHSKNKENSNKNEILYMAIVIAANECDAVEKIFINEDEITLDANGDCISPARFVGLVKIKIGLGSPNQEAESFFVSETDGQWTAEHRLRGLCTLYVKLVYDAAAFSGGIPNVTAIVRGMKVLDWRNGITAWSDNPVLCMWDYLYRRDTRGLPMSLGLDLNTRDTNYWTLAANIADELVSTPAGTEPRFSCNGVLSLSDSITNNIEAMLSSMTGRLSYVSGRWRLFVGAYITPTIDLYEDDISVLDGSDLSVTFQARRSRSELINSIRGTYVDKAQDYNLVDMPEVVDAQAILDDGGERQYLDLKMPFTNSPYAAQRLANIALKEARQQGTLSLPLNLKGMNISPGANVTVTLKHFGWDKKVFKCVTWNLNDQGQVEATFREDDVSVYDNVVVYIEPVTIPTLMLPKWSQEDPLAPTSLSAVGISTAIKVSWDEVEDPAFSKMLVYMASSNDRSLATIAATSSSFQTTITGLGNNDTRYFWIRSQDTFSNISSFFPASATAGISATTFASGANLVSVDVTVTAADLNAGDKIVINSSGMEQYYIRNITLAGGTDFDALGDKSIIITDGTTEWTEVADTDLISLSPASWGSTIVPYPVDPSDIVQSSVAGIDIVVRYGSSGTVDYTSGNVVILVIYERKP